ncbi:MAG: DedA family protein [Chloroflexota bacterium]|nr:DedA family protein [Chloroflexota bacterium]
MLLGLAQYGLPALFGAILVAALGVPLPGTLLLLAAGAFVAQGGLDLWWVLGLATAAAVLGDQLGYGLGRWGSARLVARLSRWGGGADRLGQAERLARRWGGWGVFLSRWLLTPLGPVLNLTSGLARYPWPAFLCFDVAGEAVWVTLYVTLGRLFSDQAQTLSAALGNLTWALVGLVGIAVLGRLLLRRPAPDAVTPPGCRPTA